VPKGFTIAGSDGKFVSTKALIIQPDAVMVYSVSIDQPVAVRYAWADNPVCNLEIHQVCLRHHLEPIIRNYN